MNENILDNSYKILNKDELVNCIKKMLDNFLNFISLEEWFFANKTPWTEPDLNLTSLRYLQRQSDKSSWLVLNKGRCCCGDGMLMDAVVAFL